ncbi:hypothetical protein ONS96_000294 [Cadophora gregata f. sp. sojae]|nr:hypothetical protein ONS96_000294 [Cadophora gregata f. sp. sojae]
MNYYHLNSVVVCIEGVQHLGSSRGSIPLISALSLCKIWRVCCFSQNQHDPANSATSKAEHSPSKGCANSDLATEKRVGIKESENKDSHSSKVKYSLSKNINVASHVLDSEEASGDTDSDDVPVSQNVVENDKSNGVSAIVKEHRKRPTPDATTISKPVNYMSNPIFKLVGLASEQYDEDPALRKMIPKWTAKSTTKMNMRTRRM